MAFAAAGSFHLAIRLEAASEATSACYAKLWCASASESGHCGVTHFCGAGNINAPCAQVTLPGAALRRVMNASPQGDIMLAPGFALGALSLVTGLGSGGFVAPSLLVGTLQLQSGG